MWWVDVMVADEAAGEGFDVPKPPLAGRCPELASALDPSLERHACRVIGDFRVPAQDMSDLLSRII
jgi:hypothetical protein